MDFIGIRVIRGWASERGIIARRGIVDEVLNDSCIGHGKGSEDEAHCDSCDGAEGNANFSEAGVDDTVHDRDEDNDGNGINILHDIVRDAVEFHGGSLGDEVV